MIKNKKLVIVNLSTLNNGLGVVNSLNLKINNFNNDFYFHLNSNYWFYIDFF
jgi:hypothetical protein